VRALVNEYYGGPISGSMGGANQREPQRAQATDEAQNSRTTEERHNSQENRLYFSRTVVDRMHPALALVSGQPSQPQKVQRQTDWRSHQRGREGLSSGDKAELGVCAEPDSLRGASAQGVRCWQC
jgi:hypothetical protein